MKLHRRHTKRGRVEIIPMIDTILILLIFYMSFSQFKAEEKRIDAKVPGPPAESAVRDPLDIVLHVHDREHIAVAGGGVFRVDDLAVYMSQVAMVKHEGSVAIKADPDTAYGDVVAALDACALARFKRVGFVPVQQ